MRFITPIVIALSLVSTLAVAADTRTPVAPTESRATAIEYDGYHQTTEIVRHRSKDKSYVTFHADPQLLEPGAVAVIEVTSFAETGVVPRYRCVAQRDIAECLGVPLKLRYLYSDHRMVMKVTIQPSAELAPTNIAIALK